MAESGPTVHQVPDVLNVPEPNEQTIAMVRSCGARVIAEIGVYEGATSEGLAAIAHERRGQLHLFDFEDRVRAAAARLARAGYADADVVAHPNSRRLLDSYNWSLMKVIEHHPEPIFDYVFIDGLTFFLADRLLKPGGHLDFDDYTWSLAASQTMSPRVLPMTAELHTQEQIDAQQVALVVDLLVRRDGRYEEVVADKAYRKVAS